MSAPRNDTPTPHRGFPSVIDLGSPKVPEYRGRHWLVEGETPAQFRVANLIKVNQEVAR